MNNQQQINLRQNIYLNEKEAAEILNISPKKLQKDRLRREGMPYYKIGRAVRYKTTEIYEWMEQQKVNYL